MTTACCRSCARFLHQVRRLYWRIFRPLTLGVAALVIDTENRIWLVKNFYRDGWHLPGGGVKRGENMTQAIQREVREELGLTMNATVPELFGVYSNFSDRNYDHVVVFVIRAAVLAEPQPNFEIEAARAYSPAELPSGIGAGSERRIREFLGAGAKSFEW